MRSDGELALLLQQGDEKAFEEVFSRYFDGLCLFAESITRDHQAAEDVVEDVFLHIWANSPKKPINTSIKAYLYRSTFNNSVKYITRKRANSATGLNNPGNPAIEFYEIQADDYPIANLIVRELEEKVTEAIRALPDQCRSIYLLNRDEDLNYRQIAERLHVSESTVKTQMSRAFGKLREFLKDYLYLFF